MNNRRCHAVLAALLDRLLSRRGIAVLLVVFSVLWFGSLDYRKLIRPDEGRYATIAHEMATTGDWVIPRLNGLIYLEKPPLQYWATATAFRTFGEHDWVARLWPALTGFLGILFAALAGCRLFGRQAGIFAALALATSFFYFVIGHLNTLDMGLSFFLQLALSSFLIAHREDSPSSTSRNWMLLAWAAAAFAVLSKGLIALVIPGATLMLYLLFTRDFTSLRRLHTLPGILLFAVLAVPWHVLAQLRTPEFANFYFLHEHFQRFLTTTHSRVQPWWYYLPLLLAAAMPWSLIALHAVADSWKQPGQTGRVLRFLTIWCGFTLLFFSASGSKLPSYILPILPALALIVGEFLSRISLRVLRLHLMAVALIAAVVLILTLVLSQHADTPDSLAMLQRYQRWLVASAAVWLSASLLALHLLSRQYGGRAILALACGAAGFSLLAMLGHESLSDTHSAWRLSREIRDKIPAGSPVYVLREFDHTLPYYLHHDLILVNYRDEMDFGLSLEPQRGVPTVAQFEVRWQADADAFAVMAPDTLKELESHGLPMQVVARDARQVIIRKPPPED